MKGDRCEIAPWRISYAKFSCLRLESFNLDKFSEAAGGCAPSTLPGLVGILT